MPVLVDNPDCRVSQPDLSVVIPAFNRSDIIPATLDSVLQSKGDYIIEIIIVDDGSDVPLCQNLSENYLSFCRVIRQPNQGLLYARLAGLIESRGRYVLFLDSDDFLSVDKLANHIHSMDSLSLDVSFTNSASAVADHTGLVGEIMGFVDVPDTRDPAFFFLRIQPAPHSPVYRRDYLNSALQQSPIKPSSKYNPIAEIYFYFVCSLFPASIAKCSGLAIVGVHSGVRITHHWEPMGLAVLAIMETFLSAVPNTNAGQVSRRYIAEAAFHTWRVLPYDFPLSIRRRFKAVASSASRARLCNTGGRFFCTLSFLIGPFTAGYLLRRLRGKPYQDVQSMSLLELQSLILKY